MIQSSINKYSFKIEGVSEPSENCFDTKNKILKSNDIVQQLEIVEGKLLFI